MRVTETLRREYFDDIYRRSEDPWSFATSAYEAAKYARSIASVAERHHRGLEIGCSIGVFTGLLARRCDSLVAMDISALALELARERCAGLGNVSFVHGAFPREAPAGPFDLIACCEVGYYWSDADLAAARAQIATVLAPGGEVLLVHYLPRVPEYVRDGDAVHDAFLADGRFTHVRGHRSRSYRLDVLGRP